MKALHIVLILVGAFVAYNIAVVAYALTKPAGIYRVVVLAKYAPWIALLL